MLKTMVPSMTSHFWRLCCHWMLLALKVCTLHLHSFYIGVPPGKHWPRKGVYGDVRPWRPPFHASPAARKGPISSKKVSSQDPLLRKFGNFSLNSLNFHPNFSSQAPKFGNFQLTSPQIWKFSAHKPPFSEANVSSQAPHFRNPGRTPLPEKKLSAPPGGVPLRPITHHPVSLSSTRTLLLH